MSSRRAPSFAPRRQKDLRRELTERARVWLPDWRPQHGDVDVASAIFDIAARLGSEVTQRFARVPDKAFRGFLHWLGIRGAARRSARLPIAFDMSPGSVPVDARAGTQIQVVAGDDAVVFETAADVHLVPATLATLIAADPASDAFFLAPPRVLAREAPPHEPGEWRLKSDATRTQLQLEPAVGLAPGMILVASSDLRQMRVVAVENGIVTLAAKLAPPGLAAGTRLQRLDRFEGFDQHALDRQEHVLYIGATSVLNIAAAAAIEVRGASVSRDVDWSFWGKESPQAAIASWIPLEAGDGDRLVLHKPKGTIDPRDIEGRSSRWIRAVLKPKPSSSSQASGLRLLVNCHAPSAPVVDSEGIANTAPLVMDAPFHPLGREPKVFDAFYLGSKETFSKPNAHVTLEFTMGDGFGGPLAAVALPAPPDPNAPPAVAPVAAAVEHLVVGIGFDGRLHRLWVRSAADGVDPTIEFLSPIQPDKDGRAVSLLRGARPGAVSSNGRAYVTVASEDSVWCWSQASGDAGEWTLLGAPASVTPAATVLARAGDRLLVHALFGSRIYSRALGEGAWKDVPVHEQGEPAVKVATIAPVVRLDASAGELLDADGLTCIDESGALYVRGQEWERIGTPEKLDASVAPLVIDPGGDQAEERRVCVAKLAGVHALSLFSLARPQLAVQAKVELVGRGLDLGRRTRSSAPVIHFTAIRDGVTFPASWRRLEEEPTLGHTPVGAVFSDGPLALADRLLVPTTNGDVVVYGSLSESVKAKVEEYALVASGDDWSHEPKLLIDFTPAATSKQVGWVSSAVQKADDGTWVLELEDRPAVEVDDPIPVVIYRILDDERIGSRDDGKLTLAAGDATVVANTVLYVAWDAGQRIASVTEVDSGVATLKPALPKTADGKQVRYRRIEERAQPSIMVRPGVETTGLSARARGVLGHASLLFPALKPFRQSAKHIVGQQIVVLTRPWAAGGAPDPGSQVELTVEADLGEPTTFAAPRPRNPALSWEYWDGSGWRLIPKLDDGTNHLVKGGEVKLYVPPDLQPTDVVGHTNHWIRARLVGGDYGPETVTVTTTPSGPPDGKTTQTFTRSSGNVRAPYVRSLQTTYELCSPVTPDFVLAADSGGIRDLTEANRIDGGALDFFVPLADALGRHAIADESGAGGRALYLGFDTELQGAPIRLLFLVGQELDHDDAFPLRVEALIDDRFVPVAAQDETRGLGESGVISFTLGAATRLTSLFGKAGHWIRLRPRRGATAAWRPSLRGVFLNATWALAAETQEHEVLGSSDGSPGQRFALARPPILADSLELRVREPLGEEALDELRRREAKLVLDADGPRPGPWVLWREVNDPDDAGPGDRVYALDSERGEIRFGDGRHGRIPPIGREAILAVRYRRGGGAAANAVGAWAPVNLVTPVQGVQGVIAPEGAAGGSDAQDPAAVVHFAPANLGLRDRALTAGDFESLALQFAPEIAQARALATGSGALRVVIVVRGRDPRPSSAVCRELKRYLLGHAVPGHAADDALRVDPAEPIPVRVRLFLTIASVEDGGRITADASARVAQLLDPATGGHDGRGWPLGEVPDATDVAACLTGIEHLQGVQRVDVLEVGAEGKVGALERPLRPLELVTLAPNGVSVELTVDAAEDVA